MNRRESPFASANKTPSERRVERNLFRFECPTLVISESVAIPTRCQRPTGAGCHKPSGSSQWLRPSRPTIWNGTSSFYDFHILALSSLRKSGETADASLLRSKDGSFRRCNRTNRDMCRAFWYRRIFRRAEDGATSSPPPTDRICCDVRAALRVADAGSLLQHFCRS